MITGRKNSIRYSARMRILSLSIREMMSAKATIMGVFSTSSMANCTMATGKSLSVTKTLTKFLNPQ